MSTLQPNALHHQVLEHVAREHQSSSYLEIGVREGDSLRAVCTGAGHALRVIALCDTWGFDHGGTGRKSPSHIWHLLQVMELQEGIISPAVVHMFSMPSGTLLPALTCVPHYALVHVDGDHSEEGALRDMVEGWRLCSGVMVVHDAHFTEVGRAIEQFKSQLQQALKAVGIERAVLCETYTGDHGTAVFSYQDR